MYEYWKLIQLRRKKRNDKEIMQLRRKHKFCNNSKFFPYFRMRSAKAHDTYSCIAQIPTITQRQVQLCR